MDFTDKVEKLKPGEGDLLVVKFPKGSHENLRHFSSSCSSLAQKFKCTFIFMPDGIELEHIPRKEAIKHLEGILEKLNGSKKETS